MEKYLYKGKEYDNLWQLRSQNKNLVFSSSSPVETLKDIGIEVVTYPDPEPVVAPPHVETEEEKLQNAKNRRDQAVDNIVVFVDDMAFDGNEKAQRRMSAALDAWPKNIETIDWVLHDDSVRAITYEQLEEAFNKSVQEMLALWTEPYSELEKNKESTDSSTEEIVDVEFNTVDNDSSDSTESVNNDTKNNEDIQ